MQTNEIDGLAIPEICHGLDINWTAYTPPGGRAWVAHFNSAIRPSIADFLANAKDELARLQDIAKMQSDIRRGLADAAGIGATIDRLSAIPDCGLPVSVLEELRAWNAQTARLASSALFDVAERRRSAGEIKADIQYLTALRDYFVQDLEFDMTLFAMHSVAPRFKAKLFRHVIRLLPSIETNRTFIKQSKATVKEAGHEIVADAFETLDEAYSVISVGLRKMKKEAAKGKPGFWERVA